MVDFLKYFPSLEGEERVFIQNLLTRKSSQIIGDFASFYNARRRDPQMVLMTSILVLIMLAMTGSFWAIRASGTLEWYWLYSRAFLPGSILVLMGISGAHRFYLGQYGMAILYMFTAGLFGVGTALDIFRYKNLAYERNIEIAKEIMYQVDSENALESPKKSFATPVSVPVSPSTPHTTPHRQASLAGLTGSFQGQQVALPSSGLVMGRDPSSCNLVLKSSAVSRRHARLSPGSSPDSWILEDLNSTNGTYVLDKSSWVKISTPVSLTIFRRFRLGDGENEFEIR